jgi:hypothetical protein
MPWRQGYHCNAAETKRQSVPSTIKVLRHNKSCPNEVVSLRDDSLSSKGRVQNNTAFEYFLMCNVQSQLISGYKQVVD